MSTTTPEGRTVTVTAVTGSIIRVTSALADETPTRTQAAILEPQGVKVEIESTDTAYVMSGLEGFSVRLNRKSGSVSFVRADGKILLRDTGLRVNPTDTTQALTFALGAAQSYYGAGERGHSLVLNDDTLTMYNRQNYSYTEGDPRTSQMGISMPWLVSDGGFGLLMDDYAPATLIVGNPLEYISENPEPVSFYFVRGNTLADVVENLTALVGRQPLPPFWSLGYITSKYGYRTQAETLGVVDTLKEQGYPLDGVVLDLYWYGKESDMGRLEWNPQQWPEHRRMLADLKSRGVHTTLISQPYVNKIGALDNYNLLSEKGLLARDSAGQTFDVTTWVGPAGMLDVSNPDTRQWLRDRYQSLTDEGVGGWWGDLGEPEVHPSEIRHANGQTARQYHNVYGNEWSKIIYDLYAEKYPDTRLMTLMRGGTTGLQRYSVFPWTTDVSRSWGGLQPQVKLMLSSGLSGLGYMSSDIGGFAINPDNPIDQELYLRWLQMGIFTPVLRTHSQQNAEPYHYPDIAPQTLGLIRERYRWLPYIYTLAWENATKGYPMARPLNFHGDTAEGLGNVADQYLWGENLMIAPVVEAGVKERRVVIPSGRWVDFNNPKVSYEGPSTIQYPVTLETLPLFVRAGAFLPQSPYSMENTSEYNPERYNVLYYPRGNVNSSFTLYDDDRTSARSLVENKYVLITFTGAATPRDIEVKISLKGSYPSMPSARHITLSLPGISAAQASSVEIDGASVKPEADAEGYLTIPITLISNATVSIRL